MQINLATIFILMGLGFVFSISSENASADPNKFVQDRFAIGFWSAPRLTDQNYKDIADANFTMVIGGANTQESLKKQIKFCEKYDLKAIVSTANFLPDEFPVSPAVWGYLVKDEPPVSEFPKWKKVVEEIHKARPGRLAYINLYPNYASEKTLGAEAYEVYVRKFLEEVDVGVLSMDHYPWMFPDGTNGCEAYCENLATVRKYSLQKGIPFWNFFNTMPFYTLHDPTESQIRWQIYTSLAYGSKGVMYFCYQSPHGREYEKGGAILNLEGRKTRHYDQARRINREVKNLGPTLMKLTSTGVHRVKPYEDKDELLKDTPIKILTNGYYLVGVFKHDDGRTAVLLNNYNHSYTAWPTVKFNVPLDQVREVCKKTGKEIPVIDDSSAVKGLQISLDSAEGRLFLLPSK